MIVHHNKIIHVQGHKVIQCIINFLVIKKYDTIQVSKNNNALYIILYLYNNNRTYKIKCNARGAQYFRNYDIQL